MPVLSDFQPENQSYARSANGYISGMDAGSSLMARKQAMDIQQQRADQQKQEFLAKLPLIQASAISAQVSAKSAVDTATQQEYLSTKAAAEAPGFQKEYFDAMQMTDWGQRADALAALQPKISYLNVVRDKGVPLYQGFVSEVNNARLEAHNSADLDNKLQAESDKAELDRQNKLDIASTYADQRSQSSANTLEGRKYAADASATARTDSAGITAQSRRDAAITQANHTYEYENTMQLRDDAIRRGDNRSAQDYQDRLNKMNTSALSTSDSIREVPKTAPAIQTPASSAPPAAVSISIPGSGLPASNDGQSSVAPASAPAATPVQPAVSVSTISVKPKQKVIMVEGKVYDILVDKNGNKAYRKDDGTYHEVKEDAGSQ